MADSEFWHEMAEKFRALELPHPASSLHMEWTKYESEEHYRFAIVADEDNDAIRSQFFPLAVRAGTGLPATPQKSLMATWIEALIKLSPKRNRRFGHTRDDGTADPWVKGTLSRLCEASANLCSYMEFGELERERETVHPVQKSVAQKENGTRRSEVDDFLRRCNVFCTAKINRKHLWMSVGHAGPRQFQYWQACDDRATSADEKNFRRVLLAKPEKFIAQLERQNLIRTTSKK